MGREIFTVGHSTHSQGGLLALLRAHGVEAVIDVRRFPSSRRLPHFNREPLAAGLAGAGIAYEHLPELGGRRKARPDSPNGGWEVAGFRGYADHMETEQFAAGLRRLEAGGRERRVAFMCAEAPWWRCHRRLVADALTVRGWDVRHIGPDGALTPHELPDFAIVEGERISYPPP